MSNKGRLFPQLNNWLWFCIFFLLSILPYSKALKRKRMCFLEVSFTLMQTTVKKSSWKNLTPVLDPFAVQTAQRLESSLPAALRTPAGGSATCGFLHLLRQNYSSPLTPPGGCILSMELLYKYNCSNYSDQSATCSSSQADQGAEMWYQLLWGNGNDSFLFKFSCFKRFWRQDDAVEGRWAHLLSRKSQLTAEHVRGNALTATAVPYQAPL